jgi:hypothetical protein
MKIKKKYIILLMLLICISATVMYKDVIFQEGNPLPVINGMLKLNDDNTYIKIKDNPVVYITKSNNKEGLFKHIENNSNVAYKEQMGSAYIFEGPEKAVILTTRQYTRFYQIWGCFERNIVNLHYSDVSNEVLKEGYPKENMMFEKSISLEDLYDNDKVVINLYSDKILEESVDSNLIYAFLEFKGKMYDIGYVSNYGLEDLTIEAVDRTDDSINDIEIVGDMGATYIEMKIIKYNNETKKFVNVLTMGTPKTVDLDQDGSDELMGVSVGSLPGYVDVYRWNENHFEKVEISEATNSTYVNLEYINDIWYFVTSTTEAINNFEFRYFIYNNEKLLEH